MHLLDLFCGNGGWSIPWLARGHTATGVDHVDRPYPGSFVHATLPLPIAQFIRPDTRLIVASPPCEAFARHHLPWIHTPLDSAAVDLLNWTIGLIALQEIPMIVECSCFASRHSAVPATLRVGPYALWGSVPALLPVIFKRKSAMSGLDPASRALVDQALAGWICDHFTREVVPGTPGTLL